MSDSNRLAVPNDYFDDQGRNLRFLDGERLVPTYLANMLTDIQTERYTYDHAVKLANKQTLGGYLGRVQQRIVKRHFDGRS